MTNTEIIPKPNFIEPKNEDLMIEKIVKSLIDGRGVMFDYSPDYQSRYGISFSHVDCRMTKGCQGLHPLAKIGIMVGIFYRSSFFFDVRRESYFSDKYVAEKLDIRGPNLVDFVCKVLNGLVLKQWVKSHNNEHYANIKIIDGEKE